MKRTDEHIQDKINKLDTLSAGIVYGREETWDKLQVRLEQKPSGKIAWRYSAAAVAAVLLLLVSVGRFYYHPVSGSIAVSKEQINNNPAATSVPAAQAPITTDSAPQEQMSLPAARHTAHNSAKEIKQQELVNANAPVLPTSPEDYTVPQNTPAPVPPTPMKVYHISELEGNNAHAQQQSVVTNTEHVDISQLPTIHIHEVERQDVQIKNLRRENRMSLGKRFLAKPDYFYTGEPATKEYNQPRNPFKAIRNLQN